MRKENYGRFCVNMMAEIDRDMSVMSEGFCRQVIKEADGKEKCKSHQDGDEDATNEDD